MKKNINPKYFSAFLAVVESNSFSHAASKAYMTQANISKHIQALEDQIGHALFIRTSKTPVITAAGKSLLEYIKKVDELNDELYLEITGSQQSLKGVVRYALPHPRVLHTKKAAMREGWKEFKNIEMNVFIMRQEDIIRKVLDGELDFGFINSLPENSRLECKFIDHEEYVLAGKPELIEKIKNGEDLLVQKYIEYPDVNQVFDEWCDNYFPEFPMINSSVIYYGGRANNIESALLMVRGRTGVGIFPKSYVQEFIDVEKLTYWKGSSEKAFFKDVYMISLAGQSLSKRVKVVMDLFLKDNIEN